MSRENSEYEIGDNIADDSVDAWVRNFPDIPREDEDNSVGFDLDASVIYPIDTGRHLLQDLGGDLGSEEANEDNAGTEEEKLEDSDILDPPQATPLLPKDEQRWVKSFDLVYESKYPEKKHKFVKVEGDDLHLKLRTIENHERESRDYQGDVPNYVVANIGFVISDRQYEKRVSQHGRKFVSFPVKFGDKNFVQINDVYPPDGKTEDGKKDRSSELQEDLNESLPHKSKSITRDYNSSGGIFEQFYYHSERVLWKALKNPDTINTVITQLEEVLPENGKVYCMVLDLHSSRYMCANCEPSSYIAQQKLGSKFEAGLRDKNYTIAKNKLFTVSRVSAEVKKKCRQVTEAGHGEKSEKTIKQLRRDGRSVVFQRDDRASSSYKTILGKYGIFTSGNSGVNVPRAFYASQRKDVGGAELEVTGFNKILIRDTSEVKRLIEIYDEKTKKNRRPEAREAIQKAFDINPDDKVVLNRLSIVYLNDKKFLEALPFAKRAYEKYCEIDPDNENTRICLGILNQIRNNVLGEIDFLVQSGELEKGLALVVRALDEDDSCGEFFWRSAQILMRRGETENALKVFRHIEEEEKFDEEIRRKAGETKTAILQKILEEEERMRSSGLGLKPPGNTGP